MLLKNRFKHFIGRYPVAFFFFYRKFGPKNNQKLLYCSETELVIEGFPRSANTFSVVAFEQAQLRPVKLAHHLHVEAQLMKAASNNTPAVALIRNPDDCIRSLLIRHPETNILWAINRYIQFYTAVKKLDKKCLVVTYEDVTRNIGEVVERINARYSTHFNVPVHDEYMINRAFSEVESINEQIDQGKESHVARPSAQRAEKGNSIDLTAYVNEMSRAMSLYESVLDNA